MPKSERIRVDYQPGEAALKALEIAAGMFPDLRQQALIDKLVITAASVLHHGHWQPPRLYGSNRDHWKLPEGLASPLRKV